MTATQRRPKSALDTVKPPLLKIYSAQCIVLLVVTGIVFSIDRVTGYSLLIGGLTAVLPNAYFARQVFRYAGAAYARQVTGAFYRGEAGKFLATLGLFASAFALVKPLNEFVLFAAYLLAMLLNALLVAVLKNTGAR